MSKRAKSKKPHRPHFQRRTDPGAPPGTIVPNPADPRTEVHVLAYDAEHFEERRVESLAIIPPLLERWPVTWVNVEGLGDASIINGLGHMFRLHALALEDVVHVHQRAKTESYGEYYFIVARMPLQNQPGESEQISFFFGKNFVLTFQEKIGGDCLNTIRNRIRAGWGRSRAMRPDYLVYTLLDAIVDNYFPLVESCGEALDELEDQMSSKSMNDTMTKVHCVKRTLLSIRRVMWPLRDAINALMRDHTDLISDETRIYLRDVHDHSIQIIDLVENYRDIAAGITEVYLARVGQRTSDVTKVLTVIATIFMPLTFIVGIYGMNFDTRVSPLNMPELEWYWGYPAVMIVMAALAVGMLIYFYRRGWLGRDSWQEDEGSKD